MVYNERRAGIGSLPSLLQKDHRIAPSGHFLLVSQILLLLVLWYPHQNYTYDTVGQEFGGLCRDCWKETLQADLEVASKL